MPNSNAEDRTRDRARTEEAILSAARTVLVQKGFKGWGVNAIAREAGCDKQLIYRYYGGLDGLAKALGTQTAGDITSALTAVSTPKVTSYGELVAAMIDAQIQVLLSHPTMQRIVALELSEPNELTRSFAEGRSEALLIWFTRIKGHIRTPTAIDAPAINAMMIAAAQQLVISSVATGGFAGVPLIQSKDWDRMRAAFRKVIIAAYDTSAPEA